MKAQQFAKKLEKPSIDDELLEKTNEMERLVFLFLREKLQQSDAAEPFITKGAKDERKKLMELMISYQENSLSFSRSMLIE